MAIFQKILEGRILIFKRITFAHPFFLRGDLNAAEQYQDSASVGLHTIAILISCSQAKQVPLNAQRTPFARGSRFSAASDKNNESESALHYKVLAFEKKRRRQMQRDSG